jgi:hypothetical protein
MAKLNRMQFEAKLEEYRQMCTNIRQLFNRRDYTVYLALFVFTGIISIGIQRKIPILFFITSSILLFLWSHEVIRQIALYRYNAYIEFKIEEKIEGLEIFTIGRFHPYRKCFYKFIPYFSIPFMIVICLYLACYFRNSCNRVLSDCLFCAFMTIIVISFIILVIWSFNISLPKYKNKEKEKWEEAQEAWQKQKKLNKGN